MKRQSLQKLLQAATLLASCIPGMSAGRPVLAATYTALDLTSHLTIPSGANGVCGSQQVGYKEVGLDNFMPIDEALLWHGTEESVVNLHPSGFRSSIASDTNGIQQVGKGYIVVSGDYFSRALLWSGSASSVVDLNPTGFSTSLATGISGQFQVGSGYGTATGSQYHALLWNGTAGSVRDLNPSGCTESHGNGISGSYQVGYASGTMTGNSSHAMLWNNTAESALDLHPDGFSRSYAEGISGSQQVGSGNTTGGRHALLWNGTAASAIDLHPAGYSSSYALGTNGLKQVGYGYKYDSGDRWDALVWDGAAASVVNLGEFLPAGYTDSVGERIDSQGNIVGYARNAAGKYHAMLWTPVPEPSVLVLLGASIASLLAHPWRRRSEGIRDARTCRLTR